jgi:hypothetical protein
MYDSARYEAAKEQEFVQTISTFLEDRQKEGFAKQFRISQISSKMTKIDDSTD